MKIPEKGSLSGYSTQIIAGLGVLAMWAAYLLDVPVYGQEPLGLGETLVATVVGLIAIRQRAGTKKAQQAAEAATVAIEKATEDNTVSRTTIPLVLACLLVLPAAGCAGKIARDEVLTPALRLAADGVREEVFRGLADAVSDGDITPAESNSMSTQVAGLWFAIAQQDREAIAERIPVWETVRPFAVRGVQDRVDDAEIGAGGASSRLERIQLFGEALTRLSERI